MDEFDDGQVGVLLGETFESQGVTYTLIKGAIEVSNASVFVDRIAFTDETWPIVNNTKKLYFNGFEMIGWYLCSSKITGATMEVLNRADHEYFSQQGNVFFHMNQETGDETFYDKGEFGLYPLEGFVTYFETNQQMSTYARELRAPRRVRTYGKAPKEDGKGSAAKTMKHHLTLIYGLSMLLVIVVLIIGINSINNFKNKETESTTQVAQNETTTEPETTPDPTTEVATTTEEETTTKKPAETTTTEEETTTKKPAETTKAATYQTYTVKEGDTLISICKKYYNSEKMTYVQKIMDFNGMKSTSELVIGMKLKIPDL